MPIAANPEAVDVDPHLWLEDVLGERSLGWVRARNAESEALLQSQPGFAALRDAARDVLDSREQIPYVNRRGAHLYNFWRDADQPRGLWRRCTLAEYRKPAPAWETVLDVDALAAAEGENWVWGGATALGPRYALCLVALSRGGADATVVREFDLVGKRFVDGGFVLPEAKTRVEWADADTLYVGSDFGPGSLTDSGYPRTVRRWRRGQPLADAALVFEGVAADVSVGVSVDRTPGFERTVFSRATDFYTDRLWLLQPGGALIEIDKPADATLDFWRQRVLISLRSDWALPGATRPRGSLLVADAEAFLRGNRSGLQLLFTPAATRSLADYTATRSTLLLNVLDNVASRIETRTPTAAGGWQHGSIDAPHPGTLSVAALHDPLLDGSPVDDPLLDGSPVDDPLLDGSPVDDPLLDGSLVDAPFQTGPSGDPLAEAFLLNYTDFFTPDTLQLGRVGTPLLETLKSRPTFFDAAGMRAEQRFAKSKDGTRVPYFVLWPAGATADGDNPTLLYGYGGFEVSMQPSYSGTNGRNWLAGGGVYVLANLRGGGEFGPGWHQAAVREHKQNSYDDLAAVAADLVAAGITRPGRLAIQGGSNGGLLVGAVMLQRPELFHAVVCAVPLLDMRRYHRLLAGASWMAEYGDPDNPADWAFISRYSPYQNVPAAGAAGRLPRVLFVTSTRDDRVHPGHARKMAARMRERGHDVLYWENIEGGHGGAADNAQRAQMLALEFAFLWLQLGPAAAADQAAGALPPR